MSLKIRKQTQHKPIMQQSDDCISRLYLERNPNTKPFHHVCQEVLRYAIFVTACVHLLVCSLVR